MLLSSGTALTALLAMVAHIHTPPLSEKGAPGQSTQVPGQPHGGRGSEGVGLPIMSVLGRSKTVPLCPFHQADQELLWGSSRLQNKGKREGFTDLRI